MLDSLSFHGNEPTARNGLTQTREKPKMFLFSFLMLLRLLRRLGKAREKGSKKGIIIIPAKVKIFLLFI